MEAIGKLRVGDFACGTGALLSAVYEQIAARHERAGGDVATLHPVMMEEVLYGCDVMPSAIHITGSTLSGLQPNVDFGQSRLYTMPYGRQADGTVKIGSLELLQGSQVQTLFNTSDPALRTGSLGEETAAQVNVDIPDGAFDLVIMNPPFTRAGSDWEGSEREEDSIKQFRGLSTDQTTQREMAAREKSLSQDTCAHGYAGIASTFAALADIKLKPGGVLALVLPLSAAAGMSWQMFRQMLGINYEGINVISLATDSDDEMSFSADTDIAECLVVCRKLKQDDTAKDKRIGYLSLFRRPTGLEQSSEIAKNAMQAHTIRTLDDGPYGGTNVNIGEGLLGKLLSTPPNTGGEAWPATRISDFSLAQVSFFLTSSRLWLPGHFESAELALAPLHLVATRGMYDMNIAGSQASAPFTKTYPTITSTYPALWNHNAKKETLMTCQPDSQLEIKPGKEQRAAEVWSTASRAHINRDFRYNSQPLTSAFTERLSIGGRAWPNVVFENSQLEYPFLIWCNSSLGLLLFWWHANRQVAGRGTITISGLESLPVLDFRRLTDDQLAKAEEIFEEFRDKDLMPAYLADADPNRALLDRRVICDLLGFDESVYEGVRRLSAKWCAEPSVHGGKPRPKNVKFEM